MKASKSSSDLSLEKPGRQESWHSLSLEQLSNLLQAKSEKGLSFDEVRNRLSKYGPNILPKQGTPPFFLIWIRQFQNPLIYVLLAAGLLCLLIGERTDAAFIAGVVILNAVIGSVQEWKAEASAIALRNILKMKASVMREAEVHEIDAQELVPGDLVLLESGNCIPADLRLLSARGLELDESLLTGESLPVQKDAGWSGAESVSLPERLNMLYAGTTCVRGRGKAIVVATGLNSAAGKLALDISSAASGKAPLMIRLDKMARKIAIFVLLGSVTTGLLGIIFGGHSAVEMFLFAVALSVSAIPEGLPVAVTISLAIASKRMANRGVIVRNLRAVEGLGSCTLIASDKTGTLTCNEITVKEILLASGLRFSVTGEGYSPQGMILHENKPLEGQKIPDLDKLLRCAVLCNEADLHLRANNWTWHGDPTDIAVLSLAHKAGWKRETTLAAYPEINTIAFEPEHKYAASFHLDGKKILICAKGAPERIIELCKWNQAELKARVRSESEKLAAAGYRVLALAEGEGSQECSTEHAPPEPSDLRFLALLAMIDPLRPEAGPAVATCRKAGIKVSMITGDHPATALTIARHLGLANQANQIVSGEEMNRKGEQELRNLVKEASVFARTVPQQKLKIVQLAQELGHFVAVTGDGANDAAALRAANIGVSMGKSGTDVARSASDLIISNDNFASIVAGIEEGRVAYDNIRNVTYLLVSTGAAEVVTVCLSLLTGLPVPFHPVQLLWLNLVTNGIQDLALAFEPGDSKILSRAPRPPEEGIFNRLMIERTLTAALIMGTVGFGLFSWLLNQGLNHESARNILLLLFVLFETVHIGNCRSETVSAFVSSPFKNPMLLSCAIAALLVHVCALYLPAAQTVLHTQPVSPELWVLLFTLSLTVFAAMELHKLSWKLRQKQLKA